MRSGWESSSSRPGPPCEDASRPGRPSSSRWALPIRMGRHPPNGNIPGSLPASPEYRLMQQDESAPSGSTRRFRTTRLILDAGHQGEASGRAPPEVATFVNGRRETEPSSRRCRQSARFRSRGRRRCEDQWRAIGAGCPPSVPTKRKREVTRRVRKALPEPTPATWIMVAPGRYIRGEEPVPKTVAPSPPLEVGEAGEGSPPGSHDLAPESPQRSAIA